jgi:hypothetical protein
VTGSPGEEWRGDRTAVILTPDHRVRVFISSTLEELAEERGRRRGGRSDGCTWFRCRTRRHFATARELERLLADDLAILLSESFGVRDDQ